MAWCRTSFSFPAFGSSSDSSTRGFFGRILSVRGEFGYWVFEGDWQTAQRPSWNYRREDGGGIIADMFCHWRYVLDHTFGAVHRRAVHRCDAHPRTGGRTRTAL